MDQMLFWLFLTLILLGIQAFFAMMEMAAVSINRVRLHYYVNMGSKRARWLSSLLENPSRLFGTTLFALNLSLQIGSECSRRFYYSLGINPDMAPVTQVFLVLVFAELTPMFAARKYSAQVIMAGIPFIYALSKILIPISWSIGLISQFMNYLVTGSKEVHLMDLTRDELQRALEEQAPEAGPSEEDYDFNILVSNILTLQKKLATHLMIPLHRVHMLSSESSPDRVCELLEKSYHSFLPVYHEHRNNIIGILESRDLLKKEESASLKDSLTPPWFVTLDTSAEEILHQFRHNKEKVSVVLDRQRKAVGILTMDNIIKALFGEIIETPLPLRSKEKLSLIDRTLRGDMSIREFNESFQASLDSSEDESLAELMASALGHMPEVGEELRIGSFQFKILEVSMGTAKKIFVRTII